MKTMQLSTIIFVIISNIVFKYDNKEVYIAKLMQNRSTTRRMIAKSHIIIFSSYMPVAIDCLGEDKWLHHIRYGR